jgi:hypothetical protein
MAVFWLAASRRVISLMMEAADISETSVNIYRSRQWNNPEDSHPHTRRFENLKCHAVWYFEKDQTALCLVLIESTHYDSFTLFKQNIV